MILVDTSVWIDHLAHGDASLQALLEDGEVLTHPFVSLLQVASKLKLAAFDA